MKDRFPWEVAREVCTEKELDLLIHLAANGNNLRQAADLLGISRSTAKDRRAAAFRKITEAKQEAA